MEKNIEATDLDIKVIAGKSTLYFGGPSVTLQASLIPANATTPGKFDFEIIGSSKNKVTHTVNGDKITVTPKAVGTVDLIEDLAVGVKFNGKFNKTYRFNFEEKLDINREKMFPIKCNENNTMCRMIYCNSTCAATFHFTADIVDAKSDGSPEDWTATIDKNDNRVVTMISTRSTYNLTVTSKGGQKKITYFHVDNILKNP